MSSVRIDKWLWSARFFKTRTLATKACELGRVDWNGQRAKASRDVKAGDRVKVETPGGEFEVEVLDVSEERGPAVVAQKLYAESDESKEKRAVAKAEQKVMNAVFAAPVTKPSKRDRRVLMKFRGR